MRSSEVMVFRESGVTSAIFMKNPVASKGAKNVPRELKACTSVSLLAPNPLGPSKAT